MRLKSILIAFTLLALLNASAQSEKDTSIQRFENDLKAFIDSNHTPSYVDWRFKEATDLENADTKQIIEITKPYLNSNIQNARSICFHLLANALYKKIKDQNQKEQIVELFCQNYLSTSEDIQTVDIVLLRLKEKDFNVNAKKYIAALKDSLIKSRLPKDICAKLLAVAQIKEAVPFLWRIAKKDTTTIYRSDLDILASLSRLGEKEAGSLLCNYYNSKITRTDSFYRYLLYSAQLSFSLDSTILNCLINDFKNIDLKYYYRGFDFWFHPAQYLGFNIASMLKDYPYPKEDYKLNPQQLLDWLNQTKNYELADK